MKTRQGQVSLIVHGQLNTKTYDSEVGPTWLGRSIQETLFQTKTKKDYSGDKTPFILEHQEHNSQRNTLQPRNAPKSEKHELQM